MATKLEKAKDTGVEIAARHNIAAEKVSVFSGNKKHPVVTVSLGNGRHISTDMVEGWEETLDKQIRKFINKK